MLSLRCEDSELQFSPERGAIITGWRVGGRELLYLDQATFDDPSKNVRGGIPVLFPLCGPLAEASYKVDGESYVMKQHGFARNLAWKVEELEQHRAVLVLSASPESLAQFPFSFNYRLTFELAKRGLKIGQQIRNSGRDPMPVQFGFHPYFLVGDKTRLGFDLPVESYSDNKSDATGQFNGFDFTREEIDWSFPEPTAQSASYRDPERGVQITVGYGEEYRALVFWTVKNSPYICLEPWSSSRLAFPQGADVHRIEPGAVLRSYVTLTVDQGA